MMLIRITPHNRALALWLGLGACPIGCEALDQATGVNATERRSAARRDAEEERRQSFVSNGDTESIRWLLANCVETGMSVDSVSRALGQDGEPVYDDRFLRTRPGYRVGDAAYRWGPDARGKSYYLVFRDDRLVNFEPSEYR